MVRYVDDVGGGSSTSLYDSNHYYLVIKGDAALNQETTQHFYRTGLNAQDGVFVFVDIGSDSRLHDLLAKVKGGPELYSRIEREAPVFLATDMNIGGITDAEDIELRRITDYQSDLEYIYDGLANEDWRDRTVNVLKQVNDYAQLKPSLFGIGINLNKLISDLIKRLEDA
jgi:hypothetical protein